LIRLKWKLFPICPAFTACLTGQTVDAYLTDLRAATQLYMDIKIFRMNRLGLPQDRIAKRVGQAREVIRDHLVEMPCSILFFKAGGSDPRSHGRRRRDPGHLPCIFFRSGLVSFLSGTCFQGSGGTPPLLISCYHHR